METACGGTGRKGGIEETRMRIHPPVFGDDFSMRVLIWSYTAGLRETAGLGDLHIHASIPCDVRRTESRQRVRGSLNKHKQT